MEITLAFSGEIPVFLLVGRLDVNTSPLLEERLLPLLSVHGQRVIFDCARLIYVSSAGLRVFISTLRKLNSEGGGMAFANLTPPVKELFHLAGLENLFLIEDSMMEAHSKLCLQ
jgi:anti-anti-sigma factor